MGTMDLKTDASAVTINLLLIVRPEEAASKEKGQREGQTEGGRGAGNIAPAPGEGGQGCSCTGRREAALEQDLGFLSSFSSLHTCCQTPKCQLFLAARRVSAGASLEPRSELCPVRLRGAQPRVTGRDTRGQRSRGCVCTSLCPALAPRCPRGLSGLCKGSRERARQFHPTAAATAPEYRSRTVLSAACPGFVSEAHCPEPFIATVWDLAQLPVLQRVFQKAMAVLCNCKGSLPAEVEGGE